MDQEELLGRVMALEAIAQLILVSVPDLHERLRKAIEFGGIVDVGLLMNAPERALEVRERRLREFAE